MATFTVTTNIDTSATDASMGTGQAGNLRQAINFANANPGTTITFSGAGIGTTFLQADLPLVSQNTTITGQTGVVIDGRPTGAGGAATYRGFLISGVATSADGVPPAVTVNVSNLTIQNVLAKGGDGADGGGGGLGAGGAVFVGENADVTLTNVSVGNAMAQGGAGAAETLYDSGGGGGLGGDGGGPTGGGLALGGGGGGLLFNGGGVNSTQQNSSGGGGGGGITAAGAEGTEDTQNQQGNGGDGGAGLGGIGGGGGGESFNGGSAGALGGTGAFAGTANSGGAGGFGGGGGGGAIQAGGGGFGGGSGGSNGGSAAGGFGGGGGAGENSGGAGGFGGGGGGAYGNDDSGGTGGVGAGAGSNMRGYNRPSTQPNAGAGGGGLAAGGAIFVVGSRTGTDTAGNPVAIPGGKLTVVGGQFTGDGVTASTGANAGAAVGQDLFLMTGSTETLAADAGQTLAVTRTIADDSATSLPTGGSYTAGTAAGGALTIGNVANTGTVTLSGANTYSGGTVLNAGTLDLGQLTSAGTGAIAFGADATLQLDFAGTTAAPDALNAPVTGFMAGDAMDLTDVASTATASYAGGVLTVSDGNNSDAVTIGAAPSGKEYAVSNDGNGHALVQLATIPAPTITSPANGTDTNDPEPTIAGTGESGDTVDLTIALQGGSTTTATAAVANGAWSYTPQSALADGNYSVTAVETSPSGTGTSAASGADTFEIDTVPPTVSSPSDTFAVNSGPTAINIAAPSDAGTPNSANLTIKAGTLPVDGTVTLSNGTTLVRTGETLTSAQLTGLEFTPTPDASGTTSAFTYTVADPAGNTSTGTATLTIAPAATPAIAGTTAGQQTANEAPVTPFSGATVTDPNDGTDTLTIQLTSGGSATGATGTLAESGGQPALTPGANGLYTLAPGSAAAVQAELRALVFTPAKGAPNSSTTTGFTLTDTSSAAAAMPATNGTTTVTDTDSAAAPTVTGGGATTTTQNAPVQPFGSASVSDPNTNSSDTLSIQLQGSGTLSGTGLGGGANGLYTLSGTAGAVTANLQKLSFTPADNASDTTTTTTFALTDTTTAGTSTTNGTTSVTDTVAPGSPAVSGLQPVTTALQDAMQPFGSASVTDPTSGATDSVTLTPSGAAGTLAGAGLTANPDGTYTLGFASPQTISQELDALTFTPAITNDGPVEATGFALTVTSSSGATSSASTAYTVDSTPNQGDFGTTTTSASSPQGEVYALYEGLLARAPDQVGGEQYVAQLQGGVPLDQVTQSILGSQEASSFFTPGSSDSDYVNQLYQRVLGRTESASEQSYWDGQLANGVSRADVADDFVFSSEHLNDIGPALSEGVFIADDATSETARLYYGLLDRSPDAGGLQGNTAALDASGSLTGLAQSFLSSSEYAADNPVPMSDGAFVNALYEAALGRAPDAGGGSYWTSQLDSGAETRAQVTVGIVESTEADQHLVGRIGAGYHIA